jgi:hypothetical protein
MSTSDLRSLIELASTGAEASFAKHGGLAPFWHCVDAAGALHLVVPPPIDDKDFSAAIMKCFMEEHDIVRYCVVDEAWIALLTDDAEAREFLSSGRGVASHPLRKEVVMFSAEDESGMLTAQREILRPSGRPPRLGPLVINDMQGWSGEGRLVGMLPRRGTVQ